MHFESHTKRAQDNMLNWDGSDHHQVPTSDSIWGGYDLCHTGSPRFLAYSTPTSDGSAICVVPDSGGEGQDIINNPDLYATNPALSPEGTGIALSGFDVADLIYDGGKLPTGVGTIT